jgi:integrase/recombinase XerD
MDAANTLPSVALNAWLQTTQASSLRETLEHFLLQFQSDHTRRNYKNDIASFFAFWANRSSGGAPALKQINEKHVLLWLEQFKQSTTRARKLACLSSFFNFCLKRKWVDENPCQYIKRRKAVARQTTQALDANEVEQLMATLHRLAFECQHEGAHAQRRQRSALLNFSLLHTLFSVGMRVDELCEMRLGDVELQSSPARIRFVTKGGDEHSTPISAPAAEILMHYIQEARTGAAPDEPVFVRVQLGSKPTKISQTAVYSMICNAAREAGINKQLSPHSARATVATVLHRGGVPLGFIQRLLNHKQITTTARYVKKANERSESAALKAPVSQWLSHSASPDGNHSS